MTEPVDDEPVASRQLACLFLDLPLKRGVRLGWLIESKDEVYFGHTPDSVATSHRASDED